MKPALIVFLFLSTFCLGQKETRFWYFGNGSGIDFSTNPPSALTNGGIFTYDCSSTISDANGNLLFYTNGVTVWNKLHVPMANGLGLKGNNSGGQSALIIPKPGSNEYYIFTVPNHGFDGLYYSIVDISQNNGLGNVISKNNLLHTPTTEKLDVYFDCVNGYYQIISHKFNSNQFLVYKIDNTGLNTTPVISAVGNIHSGGNPNSSHDAMGQMVLSNDGKKLAVAQQFQGSIQIFDFHATTGQVTNPSSISMSSPWGLAFSPNGKKLYVSHWLNTDIHQIDCSGPTPSAPVLIGNVSGTSGGYGAGYMELGPDGRIYIAKWSASHLTTIDNPDGQSASCGFSDNGFYLNGGSSMAGVCRTVHPPTQPNQINHMSDCNSTTLTLNDTTNIQSAAWDFGDGTTGNGLITNHSYTPGTYTVSANIVWCGSTYSLQTTIQITASSNLISVSQNSDCNYRSTFQISGPPLQTANWIFSNGQTSGSTNPMIQLAGPGQYSYTLITTDTLGCIDTTNGNFFIDTLPSSSFQYAIQPCALTTTFQNNSTGSDSYEWNFGDGQTSNQQQPIHTFSSPGNYNVQLIVSNTQTGCSDTSNQQIVISATPSYEVKSEIDTCNRVIKLSWSPANPTTMLWIYGNETSSNNTLTIPITQANVTVTAISNPNTNCSDTIIETFSAGNLLVETIAYPNIFTPNNDNINDCFSIQDFFNCNTTSVSIYSRWGNKVFESNNQNNCWDGKDATEGVYFIICTSESGRKKAYTLNLLR